MGNRYCYYIALLENGSEKLIKTNNERCEVITYFNSRPAIKAFQAPYPSHTGEELRSLSPSRFEREKKRSVPLNQ